MKETSLSSVQPLSSTGEALAGAFSGGFSRMIIAPLDVLKIRFQLQVEPVTKRVVQSLNSPSVRPHYTSVLQAVSSLIKEEGIRTLWRGNFPAMVLWISYMSVSFPVYRIAHSYISDELNTSKIIVLTDKSKKKTSPAIIPSLFAGAISGSVATFVTYPSDWLRTRIASQGVPPQHPTMWALISNVYKTEGIRGFFRGLFPTMMQIAPSLAVTFCSYEQSKDVWDTFFNHSNSDSVEIRSSHIRNLICGAIAGTLGKLSVYPLDTVKKRLQVQGMKRNETYGAIRVYTGTLHAIRSIISEEGIAGLYKGLSPSLLKAGTGAAVTFWSYEFAVSCLHDFKL